MLRKNDLLLFLLCCTVTTVWFLLTEGWCCNPIRIKWQWLVIQAANYSTLERLETVGEAAGSAGDRLGVFAALITKQQWEHIKSVGEDLI